METETWKAVVGYEGFYEVSTAGRVRSVTRTIDRAGRHGPATYRGKVLRPGIGTHGYPTVNLSVENVPRLYCVHKLVLEAFVGPCPPGMEARHFPDSEKSNNKLTNLSWDTRLENLRDRRRQGSLPKRLTRKCHERMIDMAAAGVHVKDIANWFGISRGHTKTLIDRSASWGG